MKILRRTILLAVALLLAVVYSIRPFPDSALGVFHRVMQSGSVNGAEWLMHCFNVPAWADGSTLRMGFRSIVVDGPLSGAWTAVIAGICAIGATLLYRRTLGEAICFPMLALGQVLGLNLIRLALVAIRSLSMPPDWAQTFVVRTHGLFLGICILLLVTQVLWWKRWRALHTATHLGREAGHVEHPDKATILPRFWQIVRVSWKPAIVLLVTVVLLGFAIHKRRPGHRSRMISGIVDELAVYDMPTAERSIAAALTLSPGNKGLMLKNADILARQGRFQDAWAILESISGNLAPMAAALRARVLVGLDRTDEAAAILDALPPAVNAMPEIAIVAAECAVRRDLPDEAAGHIVAASRSRAMIARVRDLFPYLASREQWKAIAGSDDPGVAYDTCEHALIAIRALLRVNDMAGAEQVMRSAVGKWPDSPDLLPVLVALAFEQPHAEWEKVFEKNYISNLSNLDAGRLQSHIGHCFRLNRPDLAWLGYLRLSRQSPGDPALYFIPARFSRKWFLFRKHWLGTGSGDEHATVDLTPLCIYARDLEPFKTLLSGIPLSAELLQDPGSAGKRFIELCLAELERRETAEKLSLRMSVMYADALAETGRYGEAHNRLNSIGREVPDIRDRILLKHAVLYARQELWQEAYEALTEYRSLVASPDLATELLLVNVLMRLNLGICAMDAVERIKDAFPGSVESDIVEAAVWEFVGAEEEALFVLGRIESLNASEILPALLDSAGRFKAAERMRRSLGMPAQAGRSRERQAAVLPRAEFLVDPEGVDARAGQVLDAESAASLFIRKLGMLVAEWNRTAGDGAVSDPERWRAIGRNDMEKGAALHHLSVLLARHGRLDEAAAAVAEAIEQMPRSAPLWWMRIRLTGGDAGVVEHARRVCPRDPRIWLAWLVVQTRDNGPGDWAVSEIERVVAAGECSVGTMVRAGDFLLRKGMVQAASVAAQDAMARSDGFLPAHVLGLRCALASDDLDRAAICAVQCAENARDPSTELRAGPWLYRKALVDIKLAGNKIDVDLMAALQSLREKFPDNPEFSEHLARACLIRGDFKRAEKVIAAMVKRDPGSPSADLLLLAAETVRQQGKSGEAVRILKTGRQLYPDSVAILNNLVYCLARNSETLTAAKQLLPELIEKGRESPEVRDTVEAVKSQAGRREGVGRDVWE